MEELETVLLPPLTAAQYRALWLESEDRLGLIAECLAEVLGWEQSAEQPLPDPLALAEVAAQRLAKTATRRRKTNCIGARHERLFALN